MRLSTLPDSTGLARGMTVTWHVKGNLFTGNQWANNQRNGGRGHSSGYEWYFDFNEGRSNNQPIGLPVLHLLYARVVRARFRRIVGFLPVCSAGLIPPPDVNAWESFPENGFRKLRRTGSSM